MSEPAFPYFHSESCGGVTSTEVATGLTKRELFAAMAMQGFVSADDYQHVMLGHGHQLADYAAASVRIADALLAELEKSP